MESLREDGVAFSMSRIYSFLTICFFVLPCCHGVIRTHRVAGITSGWVDGVGQVQLTRLQAGCWRGDSKKANDCCDGASTPPASCFSSGRSIDVCCPPPVPSRVCLWNSSVAFDWGRIASWTYLGHTRDASGPQWVELVALRPIYVGWRQGYKGRTFRMLGGTGPFLADFEADGYTHVSQPGRLHIQAGDVLGWRHWGGPQAGEGPVVAEPGLANMWCQSADCDEAGLCQFKDSVSKGAPYIGVSAELWPEPAPKPLPGRMPIMPALDLSASVTANTTYEEFLTIRSRIQHPSLHLFEDKIRLRQELLPSLGVKATPSILLTNTEPERVLESIQGKQAFVVKPSHMSESQNVFVVRDGINILQKAWGHPAPQVTPEEIQRAVLDFMHTSALDWECSALVSVPPGVVVEELIMSTTGGSLMVDEYKFYVVWGVVVFGESVPFSSGTVSWIDVQGNILLSRGSCPPYCVAPCYKQMVEIAERVARGAKTDFLRVDILIDGQCDGLYISELELFPASEFDFALRLEVASRWRRGYGFPG